MNNAALEAAARLAATLPKREHHCEDEPDSHPGVKRAVVVGGVIYPTMTAAARALRISKQGMRDRINRGAARFLED